MTKKVLSCKKRRIFVKYIFVPTQERSYIGFRNTRRSNSRKKPHFFPIRNYFEDFLEMHLFFMESRIVVIAKRIPIRKNCHCLFALLCTMHTIYFEKNLPWGFCFEKNLLTSHNTWKIFCPVHKWRHPIRGEGDLPKGDITP